MHACTQVDYGLDRRNGQRKILGSTAGHAQRNRDIAHFDDTAAGPNGAELLIGVDLRAGEKPVDTLFIGRRDGKAVAPQVAGEQIVEGIGRLEVGAFRDGNHVGLDEARRLHLRIPAGQTFEKGIHVLSRRARSLPMRNISFGNTYPMGASAGKPKPANALDTMPSNSERVTTTVGMPAISICAAAQPHAVPQLPQPALPTMTVSTSSPAWPRRGRCPPW